MRLRSIGLITAAILAACVLAPADLRAQVSYLTGDTNCDGAVDLIDTYVMNQVLFGGVTPPCACLAAYDVDCNGATDASDLVYLLNFLILGGPPPCNPFPTCGPGGGPLPCTGYPACPLFKRGDANQDGCVSDADATFLATYLFQSGPPPLCDRAADANDDDVLDNQDVIFILAYCNSGGATPPAPGPFVCGPDPTPGSLTCGSYPMSACAGGCRNQVQGDCNQDGAVDIGDAVCILSNLFLGSPLLPCANGDTAHPSNTALIDVDGSFAPDISDPIYLLAYLFLGGPPPSLGTGCTYIPLCPQNPSCPNCVP